MDYELATLYTMTQDQLFEHVLNFTQIHAPGVFDIYGREGRHYLALVPKGVRLYPVLASHLDIYDGRPPQEIRTGAGERFVTGWSNGERSILGGDDRNGVWTMLQLIRSGRHELGYFFSTDEELGRKGAIALTDSGLLKELSSRIAYFVQIDRRGTKDLAWYKWDSGSSIDNTDFKAALQQFRHARRTFRLAAGTKTDILVYCEASGLAGNNISEGYYDEHHEAERLNLRYTMSLPAIVSALLERLGKRRYELEGETAIS